MNFTGLFIGLQLVSIFIVASALLLNIEANFPLLLSPLYAVFASYTVFLGRRFWAYSQDKSPLNRQVAASKAYENKAAIELINDRQTTFQQLKKQTRAWLLHLNFWELGALSWLPVLWGQKKPFVCTPKQVISSTTRSTFIANVIALPKLLLVLNVVTALLVAPFSALYSPLLFACALTICSIKILAANIALENYRYQKPQAQIINFKANDHKKASAKSINPIISLSKTKSINTRYNDNEAANS